MLFSEVYGSYYNVLAKLLEKAAEGTLTKTAMNDIIREYGFEESVLAIPEALENHSWPLISRDYSTPLEHKPTMPLTTLQKRWLKALLSDPRIRLFDPPTDGLEDVEPLYPPDSIVYYDQYSDGDPFEDPGYMENFRCILSAMRRKCWLRIHFVGSKGTAHHWRCIPYRMEYSAKDDKFRLVSSDKRAAFSVNLSRIQRCTILEPYTDEEYKPKAMKKQVLVMELTDERNALERAMLHFSHLEKETERIDGKHYRIKLWYEREDETELLIRVLSFGPVLKVVYPDDFIKKLQNRLEKQKKLRTWV